MSELLQRLRAIGDNLSPRERLLLGVAGALLGLAFLLFGVVRPVTSARGRAEARAEAAEQELQVMLALRREYDGIRGGLSAFEDRIREGPKGNIFTTLEALAAQSSVKVDSMDPQAPLTSDRYKETKVQVVLKGVTLAQTVNYLHRVENAPQLLSVKSLRVRMRSDKSDLLDVTFTVSSFEPAGA